MAQGTKVNQWECVVTKIDIFSFVTPNTKHSSLFIDFIWTLREGPVNESVLLPGHFLPLSLPLSP